MELRELIQGWGGGDVASVLRIRRRCVGVAEIRMGVTGVIVSRVIMPVVRRIVQALRWPVGKTILLAMQRHRRVLLTEIVRGLGTVA